jgi:3',5'-cyclic-AMP phosphodiesterase
VLIAQLSDPHVTVGALAGPPAFAFHRAIGRVKALDPQPDCVVITGDLVDRGRAAEYVQFRELTEPLDMPVHVLPGNHDDRDGLRAAFPDLPRSPVAAGELCYAADYPGLRLLVCDSLLPGRVEGALGTEQLEWLDKELEREASVPTIVCVHHPPIRTGLGAMDQIGLVNHDEVGAVLARHPHVIRVLSGHIHRNITATVGAAVVCVAPSTYRQVNLDLRPDGVFGYVDEPPGFLLHAIDGDSCVTHLVPITHSGPLMRA